ncbi:unnamed protein product [Polarella glacialis]|uniref:DNA helicase n=1 Tax=Polarella glacialis TaxID=89957 RepID=A0A813ISC0_POLGL|nr:unnamed protein product [Polarella glacialis]CAE8659654.1 unnamed protein product [Polarella glacialis]
MRQDGECPETKEEACQTPEAFSAWTEKMLVLEREAEDEETTALLMSCSHAELQARGIAILKLCVAEQTTALYGRACLSLERPGGSPLPAHRITHGDIVGIFDQTTRPLSKAVPLASAVVVRVKPASLELAFNEGDVPDDILDGRQLSLAAISSDVTTQRYRDALKMLKTGCREGPAAGLVRTCFGEGPGPRFHEEKSEICGRPDAVDCAFRAEQTRRLNEPQQAAVVKALKAADVAIVHGPPGTGKTTTLVAYILEAVYRKQRLLVCAPSNVAVDNLLERVAACGCRSIVRLGHPARVQAQLHSYTMDNLLYASDQAALCRDIKKEIEDHFKRCRSFDPKAKASGPRLSKGELGELRKELRTRERRAVAEVLKRTQVVFATCAGAATLHREIKRAGIDSAASLEFDVVIIDEAAQALEVSCWIPLMLGKKAVLAGDHQQLAATVKSSRAQQLGLDYTLFARLIERYGDDVASLLSIQYRMNSIIMGWSSRSFYSSKLEAAESVASWTLDLSEVPAANLVGETLEALKCPLIFVDTGGLASYREDGSDDAHASKSTGQHSAVHQSRANHGESRFVVHYAKLLVKCGLSPADLTVITPYNRQVEQLRADFAEDAEGEKLGLEKPRINTVDSFQGQEADAVLISLVRSNERGVVGFLADYRRLNVAVTRARKHVMIVGDAATIGHDDMLGSLYDYACEHGKVLFVQQLLDEDGGVPADPSQAAALQEERRKVAARKLEVRMDRDKEERLKKAREEEKMRRRFEGILRPVLEGGGSGRLELPTTLNPYERAMAHEVAANLGLFHESKGEGMARQLCVWAPGAKNAGSADPVDKDRACVPSSSPSVPAIDTAESDDEQETALAAFERRAAALLDSLGPAQPAAEWKAPSEEEFAILLRLARPRALKLTEEGSGKKRRCRLEVACLPQDAASQPQASSSSSSAAAKGKESQASSNPMLAELHEARQAAAARRQAAAAEERRTEILGAQELIKVAKKASKKESKDNGAKATGGDDDDLDAVLLEFTSQEGVCAYANCKEKVHTLMDALAKCKHCSRRFCLKHVQAEVHGCGDAAQRAERKQWKQECEAPAKAPSKSSGQDRSQLANKLQDKMKAQETIRAAKKKDKK